MPLFMTQGRYTREAISGTIQAPEDSNAPKKVAEAAGGRLVAWYLTLGEYDFLAITESPMPLRRQARCSRLLHVGI